MMFPRFSFALSVIAKSPFGARYSSMNVGHVSHCLQVSVRSERHSYSLQAAGEISFRAKRHIYVGVSGGRVVQGCAKFPFEALNGGTFCHGAEWFFIVILVFVLLKPIIRCLDKAVPLKDFKENIHIRWNNNSPAKNRIISITVYFIFNNIFPRVLWSLECLLKMRDRKMVPSIETRGSIIRARTKSRVCRWPLSSSYNNQATR